AQHVAEDHQREDKPRPQTDLFCAQERLLRSRLRATLKAAPVRMISAAVIVPRVIAYQRSSRYPIVKVTPVVSSAASLASGSASGVASCDAGLRKRGCFGAVDCSASSIRISEADTQPS